MPCRSSHHCGTVDRVAYLLDCVKQIRMDELERIVQQAHECNIHQVTEPLEPFPVSRQSLRMFWHFRCNLESVEIRPSHE